MPQPNINFNETVKQSEKGTAPGLLAADTNKSISRMGNLSMTLNIQDKRTFRMPSVISLHTDVYDAMQIKLNQTSHGVFLAPLSAINNKRTGLLYFKVACEMQPTLPVILRYTVRIKNFRSFCFGTIDRTLGMPLFRLLSNWEIVYEPVITTRLNPVFLPFELICLNPDFDCLAAEFTIYVSELNSTPDNFVTSSPLLKFTKVNRRIIHNTFHT